MSLSTAQYKNDIVNRMGGPAQYASAIFCLVERLVEDPNLQKFYNPNSLQANCQMLKDILDLAIEDLKKADKERLYNRIMLHHYSLFAIGFNESHFDMIKHHLTIALRSLWTAHDVIDDFLYNFEELRDTFFGSDGSCPYVLDSLKQENAVLARFGDSLAANRNDQSTVRRPPVAEISIAQHGFKVPRILQRLNVEYGTGRN